MTTFETRRQHFQIKNGLFEIPVFVFNFQSAKIFQNTITESFEFRKLVITKITNLR